VTVEKSIRTYFVKSFGCQMNEHDSERMAGLLQAEGLSEATCAEEADVVVVNTCCIRSHADRKLYGYLQRLSAGGERKRILAVGGCLAQKDKAEMLHLAPNVDVVFGTHNIHRLTALLEQARATGERIVEVPDAPDPEDPLPSSLPARRGLAHSAWVTIQVGCNNSCSFCIVPSVRGPEISRPMEEIVSEVRELASQGVTEVTLLGQNVNSYGRDLTRRRPLFAELLQQVGAVEGIRRIRFTSPHPKDLRPETIEAMASVEAVCEQLHLPLQSGSDRILAAMRRGYTAERYLARLQAARAAVEDLAVTTDIIVGFPGETEEDFEATLEVVAEARYDSAYTFIFSPRPGTRAAAMEDCFVPADVAAERFARLKAVVDRSALMANQARVGRVEEIMVEGPSRRARGQLTGRTRQGKLLHFAPRQPESAPVPGSDHWRNLPDTDAFAPGRLLHARVTGAGAHHLRGEILDEVDPVGQSPRRLAPRGVPVALIRRVS
jgi:tRNA-2-methylthio-N6-dimethylallyladenosine synthase